MAWIYQNDYNNKVRYSLGQTGEKPLLCFGINPSTAAPDALDQTLKGVSKRAIDNGYDSWIMFNVYPQRATNPADLHKIMDNELHRKNILEFRIKLEELKGKITIWAAWGTNINVRPILKTCLTDIYRETTALDIEWVALKPTKDGHPHHPLYIKADEPFIKFDMSKYLEI